MNRFLISVLIVVALGCAPPAPRLVYMPDAVQPPPISDLPIDLRLSNYIGVDDDGDEGGSCAHVSSRNAFRVAGAWYLDDVWARTRGYEGPEYAERLLEKWDREGIPFAATEDGDVEVLEAASRTRRWATIFYYPSHSITFCGFDRVNGVESAILLDSNFTDYYIVVERRLFLDSWQRVYGGFAAVPWITPAVPRTYPRTYLQSEVAYGTIKRSILMLTLLCSSLCSFATAQTTSKNAPDKKEGWVNVPGGTVFLEPGRQAYEHDTGLVRDLATGQKSMPITPQSLAAGPTLAPALPSYPIYQVPTYTLPAYPQPYPVPISPPRSPYAVVPSYAPQPWYDLGPGNVYARPNPCNNCGAKLGAPGSINARWKTTTLPH